jgi:DNA-directed RNA polymerase subunit RPC12/RpoP
MTQTADKCVMCGSTIMVRPADHRDGDEYMCEGCWAIFEDEQTPEPDHDDTVHACPDCERPNQFGELCHPCASERGEQAYA